MLSNSIFWLTRESSSHPIDGGNFCCGIRSWIYISICRFPRYEYCCYLPFGRAYNGMAYPQFCIWLYSIYPCNIFIQLFFCRTPIYFFCERSQLYYHIYYDDRYCTCYQHSDIPFQTKCIGRTGKRSGNESNLQSHKSSDGCQRYTRYCRYRYICYQRLFFM